MHRRVKALVYTRPNEVRIPELEEPTPGAADRIVSCVAADTVLGQATRQPGRRRV